MKGYIKSLKRKLFKSYVYVLEQLVGDSKTLLDIGCGADSQIKAFSHKLHTEAVDTFIPSIEKSKAKNIHNVYHNVDVLSIGDNFKENSFDCVIALDLIEHLEQEQGFEILKQMEKIAKKRLMTFASNGFLPQCEYDNNPWQLNRSGREVEEMLLPCYEVYGIRGYKSLRTVYAKFSYIPQFLCEIISDFTQLYTYNNPKSAFQIICIKNIG